MVMEFCIFQLREAISGHWFITYLELSQYLGSSMRQPSHLIGFSSVLLLSLSMSSRAIAGDLFFILTSDYYQDVVAIGEVKSRKDSALVFRPTRVLS